MTKTKVDFIIVGLGLAGAAVAWRLMELGKKIAVFDDASANRSTSEAAGLFNPVTGKLMTKTWMADLLFPELHNFYRDVQRACTDTFFHPIPIYIPFRSLEEQNDWAGLEGDVLLKRHIDRVYTAPTFADDVFDELGGVLLKSGGYLHASRYIDCVRKRIAETSILRGHFNRADAVLTPNAIEYGDLRAGHLVLCEGLHAMKSSLTHWLPLHPLKGETLEITLDRELQIIYNRGIYVVPAESNRYKVGATYERTEVSGTTAAGRQDLVGRLRSLLRVPFQVAGQSWGLRPTTPDRRPILGTLPDYPNVSVFNGLGTKGVSLAPYFSKVLVDHLESASQMAPEVNITRFYTLSSKSRD